LGELFVRSLELTTDFGIDQLGIAEGAMPVPGPGQVLVKIAAVALNRRDLQMVQGSPTSGAQLPLIPFSDACGVITALGPGVSQTFLGRRIVSLFYQAWRSGRPDSHKLASTLGAPLVGVGREYALLAAEGVSSAPAFLSDFEAATLPCAALTAWRAVIEEARLQPGATVLLQGTGGVSIFALQIALAAGLQVIITSSSDAKLERCRAMGAHHTINYRETPDWAREVRRMTGGRGADLIVEVGGQGTIEQSLKAVRTGGEISVVGLLTGRAAGFDIVRLIPGGVTLRGINVGSAEMFENMCRALELWRIQPIIDKVYSWTDAGNALEAMSNGEHFGKIVLDVAASPAF
jgi:NADPH:quinone reductase-like Zn-dependent oxidoreductase